MMIGMSQTKLAEAVGVTFQQVQKYENGVNRISASRLQQLARALGVEVEFFFAAAGASDREQLPTELIDVRLTSEGVRLLRSFMSIGDPIVRRRVLALVQALAHPQAAQARRVRTARSDPSGTAL